MFRNGKFSPLDFLRNQNFFLRGDNRSHDLLTPKKIPRYRGRKTKVVVNFNKGTTQKRYGMFYKSFYGRDLELWGTKKFGFYRQFWWTFWFWWFCGKSDLYCWRKGISELRNCCRLIDLENCHLFQNFDRFEKICRIWWRSHIDSKWCIKLANFTSVGQNRLINFANYFI